MIVIVTYIVNLIIIESTMQGCTRTQGTTNTNKDLKYLFSKSAIILDIL